MRIAIIAHLKYPIAEPFAGGLEMHTHLLASKLRARGNDVIVFACTKSSGSFGVQAICSQTATSALDAVQDRIAEFREHHAYMTLMQQLRSSDFDIIHNNSLHYLPIMMADELPMPMITTLHTPPFECLARAVEIADWKHRALVAVSNAVRQQWADVALATDVVLNGVDLMQFHYRTMPARQPYLAWSGRIVPEKGLHFAIDAARILGMTLQFAGPAADPVYFTAEIQPRLGTDTVYAGHLDHLNLVNFVGGARALLCTPCWEEPYGLVVAEALSCGVPVAAFARGAIPTILTSFCGALATPGDSGSLAAAATIAMGLKRADCRRRAETFCDAEVMVDHYETIYRRAIGVDILNDIVALAGTSSIESI